MFNSIQYEKKTLAFWKISKIQERESLNILWTHNHTRLLSKEQWNLFSKTCVMSNRVLLKWLLSFNSESRWVRKLSMWLTFWTTEVEREEARNAWLSWLDIYIKQNNMTITMITQTGKVIGTYVAASSTLLICFIVHFQKKQHYPYLLWWTTIYASMSWVLFSSGLQPLCSQVVKPGPWIERQIKNQSRIRQNIPMDRILKEEDQVKMMMGWKTTLHESIN